MCNLLVTTKGPGILPVSGMHQWIALFMHKTLVLLLFAPTKKKHQFTSGSTELNAKLLVPSVWRGFTWKCIFFLLFLPHRRAVKCLRIKKPHVFHVKELELRWGKLGSNLTTQTTGENIPLETCTQATCRFFFTFRYHFRFELHRYTKGFWQLLSKLMFL